MPPICCITRRTDGPDRAFGRAPGRAIRLVEWASSHLLKTDPPLANPADTTIPHCVDTSDEAIALLREHHAKWLRASSG
jgi:hypothetical protein